MRRRTKHDLEQMSMTTKIIYQRITRTENCHNTNKQPVKKQQATNKTLSLLETHR